MTYRGETVYIKHLSHREHLNLEDTEEKFFNEAKNKGLPDEKEQIEKH